MDHQLFSFEIVLDAQLGEQAGRELSLLRLVHLRADNAATPNIEKEVQIEEAAPQCRAAHVRDIPAQHTERFGCDMLPGLAVALGWLAALSIAIELALPQHAPQ